MHTFRFGTHRKVWFLAGLVVAALLLGAITVGAQGPNPTPPEPNAPSPAGTAFTYQGRLMTSDTPVTGTCDFKFDVYDAATGGAHTAGPVNQIGVPVSNGLFTTAIDFGANVFTGDARWLHTAVACPSGGSYVPLSPRQELTPAPVALSLPGVSTDQGGGSPNVTIHGSDAALRIQSSGSSTYPRTIYSADSSEWHTGVGGSEVSNGLNNEYYIYDAGANETRLVIDANGNVGVGTTFPTANVEVYSQNPLVKIRNSNDTGGGLVGNSYNGLELGLYNPSGSTWGVIPAYTRRAFFGVDNSGGVGSLTNNFPGFSYRNVLDDGNGNAEISGTLMVNTVDAVTNIRNTNDTGGAFIGNTHSSLELGLYNPSGSTWGVIPANTRRTFFGVDYNGGVGSLTNNFPGLSFRNLLDDGFGSATISAGLFVYGYTHLYSGLRVDHLGAVGSTSLCQNAINEVATCSSSLRYKNNIADLPLGLDTVMQLRPVTYDWKSNGQHDLGLVAEEVNAVAPILTTYNEAGQIEGVKYDHLTAVLVKRMQEQQAQIADEKAQNETLQKKSDDLATQLATQQKKSDELATQLATQQNQIDALSARLAALEQEGPAARTQSPGQPPDWNLALMFVVGAVAVVVIERRRKPST